MTNTTSAHPVLSISDLHIAVKRQSGPDTELVRGVSLDLAPGEVLGLIGESGSGKTLTALSILGLLHGTGVEVTQGEVRLGDRILNGMSWNELREIRGGRVGMVFQDPMTSLNPVLSVGVQIEEALRAHLALNGHEARKRAIELLNRVRIPNAARRIDDYPHEFSGGMRQRAMIAMALSCDPAVLIADEPTTALDVTVQSEILDLIGQLQSELHMAVLFISHDLGVVAGLADRVAIMYAGKIVETARTDRVFKSPRHPYTVGLLGALPSVNAEGRSPLHPIPGSPPRPGHLPAGCAFRDRCASAVAGCIEVPVLAPVAEGGSVACWNPIVSRAAGGEGVSSHAITGQDRKIAGEPILRTEALQIVYGVGAKSFSAVDGVDLTLFPSETLGLVGESGSGKTSVARGLLRLLPPASGRIWFGGSEITHFGNVEMKAVRRQMQMVFQDPYASLNPKKTVQQILSEPLRVHNVGSPGGDRTDRIVEALRGVGLPEEARLRYPSDFSGGQRQRIGIARALILEPKVIIFDEPVASLDVSVQAQVLNLIASIQERTGIAYLFVAHDLSVVNHISDRVAVMYAGRIVEVGPTAAVFGSPGHPYTYALMCAVPIADPDVERARTRLPVSGEPRSDDRSGSGCRFRSRCTMAQPICATDEPQLRATGHSTLSACHFSEDVPAPLFRAPALQ